MWVARGMRGDEKSCYMTLDAFICWDPRPHNAYASLCYSAYEAHASILSILELSPHYPIVCWDPRPHYAYEAPRRRQPFGVFSPCSSILTMPMPVIPFHVSSHRVGSRAGWRAAADAVAAR